MQKPIIPFELSRKNCEVVHAIIDVCRHGLHLSHHSFRARLVMSQDVLRTEDILKCLHTLIVVPLNYDLYNTL